MHFSSGNKWIPTPIRFSVNVVFDVSVFGSANRWPAARAGVFRVVDSLARELSSRTDCNFACTAVENDLYYHAAQFMERDLDLCRHQPRQSKTGTRVWAAYRRANSEWQRHAGAKRFLWRTLRRQLQLTTQFFIAADRDRNLIRKCDVFHSPYHGIPDWLRRQSRAAKFITVHVLIPILHPEFFVIPPGTQHEIDRLVKAIKQDDWVVCVSQNTKDDLCNFRKDLDPNRVFVTPLGVSKTFLPCMDAMKIEAVRQKYQIPAGPYFASVCTLEPRKNLPHLVGCFADAVKTERLSDVNLVLVGSRGWKFDGIFNHLQELPSDIRNRIILPGRVDEEDMSPLYSGAVAFVYPSLYEGFGLPPLEAMKCGTPVITSNRSSLPEVVGDAGVQIDPQDKDALSAAMVELYRNTSLRHELSVKALEWSSRFTWTRCADETVRAYRASKN